LPKAIRGGVRVRTDPHPTTFGRRPPPFRGRKRDAGENGREETEGGGDAAFRCRDDFMQSAAGEAAIRQVGIDCPQAEGQGFALLPHPGHEPAQLRHHGGAVSRHGMGGGLGHGAKPILSHVSSAMFPWKTMGYSLYVLACRY
jgi:hypothetical protein